MVKDFKAGKDALLIVGNHLFEAGMTRQYSEDFAARLAEAGYRVIVTSGKKGRVARMADMLSTAWRRRNEYSVAQIAVFSGPSFFWAEAVCGLLRVLDKRFVLTLHGGNLPAFAIRHPGRVKRLLLSAACVTAPSGYLKRGLEAVRGDIRYIPNALDVGRYPFHSREHVAPKLIWLRSFHKIYNPLMAVRTLDRLVGGFGDAELKMIGPDKGDGSLEATAAETRRLGLEGRVAFPGGVPKSEVPLWMNRGDIFINTTSIDNTPLSVIEAMACGLCVVSTDVGGIPYLLEDDRDALLVPPDDPGAMARAIRRILTEPGLAGRLSVNARRKAEGFDWAAILPQWKRLIEHVAEGGEADGAV